MFKKYVTVFACFRDFQHANRGYCEVQGIFHLGGGGCICQLVKIGSAIFI